METVKSETKAKDNDTVLKPENDSLTWEEAVYKGAEILTDFKELKDDDAISKDGNEHPEVSSAFCFYYYAVALAHSLWRLGLVLDSHIQDTHTPNPFLLYVL